MLCKKKNALCHFLHSLFSIPKGNDPLSPGSNLFFLPPFNSKAYVRLTRTPCRPCGTCLCCAVRVNDRHRSWFPALTSLPNLLNPTFVVDVFLSEAHQTSAHANVSLRLVPSATSRQISLPLRYVVHLIAPIQRCSRSRSRVAENPLIPVLSRFACHVKAEHHTRHPVWSARAEKRRRTWDTHALPHTHHHIPLSQPLFPSLFGESLGAGPV